MQAAYSIWIKPVKKTTMACALLLAILIGIGVGNKVALHINLLIQIIIFLSALIVMRSGSFYKIILIALAGLILGISRGADYHKILNEYEVYYHQKITGQAVAAEDAAYGRNGQLSFAVRDFKTDKGIGLRGKIMISGYGANAVYEGDRVHFSGKFYPGYGAYQGRISYAELSVRKRGNSTVSNFRRSFAAGLQSVLPEPSASFAMGILIGQRSALPEEVKKALLMIGLTHIIAVSGYNLTIILNATNSLLRQQSKRLATLLAISLIATFLMLTGSSASIVRAAIISLLSIFATYHGRKIKPLVLISLAASITAWANPVYLWSDASWHLSFLAFAGILILAPLIKSRVKIAVSNTLIGAVALESICAEIMTMPYLAHSFGQISLIGLAANLLIASMVPAAMLASLVAGIVGIFNIGLTSFLAWPAVIILGAMLSLSNILAQIPGVFVENIKISLVTMIACYIFTGIFIGLLHNKTKDSKHVNITDTEQNNLARA